MTIPLTAVGGDGLFDILGKAFYALATLNTARSATIPTEVEDFVEQVETVSGANLNLVTAVSGIPDATSGWQSNGASLAQTIAQACQAILIEFVSTDAAQPDNSLYTAMAYLVDQMEASGDYVDGNTVAITLAAGASNLGDLTIAYTHLGGDGRTRQQCYAEAIAVEVTDDTSDTAPQLTFLAPAATADYLHQDWPDGSGTATTLTATDPADTLLTNGNFEDTTNANVPDDWNVYIGTVGTHVLVTDPEIQTITFLGTPTAGTFTLIYIDRDNVQRPTTPLAYDCAAADIEAALQEIPGLEEVTVDDVTTGVFSVTFDGVGGPINLLTSASKLSGATIQHRITRYGESASYRSRSLKLVSNGAAPSAVKMYHTLTDLAAETVYFVFFRACVGQEEQSSASTESSQSTSSQSEESSSSSSHSHSSNSSSSSLGGISLIVEIMDGIEGSVTQDKAGNANSLTTGIDDLPVGTCGPFWFSFRLKRDAVLPVYLRLRLSGIMASGQYVIVDDVSVVAGTELYAGGPYVAAFIGRDPAVLEDSWTLTVTNSRAGALQDWFHRCFGIVEMGLMLPVSGGGSLIPDSLIA